ncbi:MAG: hypothetical protein VX453_06530 [Acidobacteriota bacterium]|nr:hypothetical protein [Acidobacteriota bacterium]
MALGDLLYEETGQVTSVRVLPSDDGEVVTEVCVQTQGTIQGVEENTIWTYTSRKRADGTMVGEGNGVTTTKDGEVINLTGTGAARATPPGEVIKYRGAVYFYSTSQKWAKLNGVAGVHEYDLNPDGSLVIKFYAWN